MVFESKIGLEAEFFTTDKKDNIVLPPTYVPTDDFPLVGEIRAEAGDRVHTVIANFISEKMRIEGLLSDRYNMCIASSKETGLKVYREAMARCRTEKNEVNADTKNIYGTDISDFSDQIIKGGKIQGIRASCGLHIHFSCRHVDEYKVETDKYEVVRLPLTVPTGGTDTQKAITAADILLYRLTGAKEVKKLVAQASLLNKPTVEYMVRKLDEAFFERFAPAKQLRTKYRQPGFFELKPHGFEYRSLPASPEVLAALPEIVTFGFELLKEAKEYS